MLKSEWTDKLSSEHISRSLSFLFQILPSSLYPSFENIVHIMWILSDSSAGAHHVEHGISVRSSSKQNKEEKTHVLTKFISTSIECICAHGKTIRVVIIGWEKCMWSRRSCRKLFAEICSVVLFTTSTSTRIRGISMEVFACIWLYAKQDTLNLHGPQISLTLDNV